MNVADILGVLGFFLAAGTFGYIYYREHLPLKMYVAGLDIEKHTDNSAKVIFHLCWVNPSLSGRTVVDIKIDRPLELKILNLELRYDQAEHAVEHRLPNQEQVLGILPSDRLLEFPLDIPPHQSVHKWQAFYLSWDNNDIVPLNIQRKCIVYFQSLNHDCKMCASSQITIYKEWLENGGLYATHLCSLH